MKGRRAKHVKLQAMLAERDDGYVSECSAALLAQLPQLPCAVLAQVSSHHWPSSMVCGCFSFDLAMALHCSSQKTGQLCRTHRTPEESLMG